MDISLVLATLAVAVVAFVGTRVVVWVWLRPKLVERRLREQGLGGTPYRVLTGDMMEIMRMAMDAQTKPMPPRSHDIAPRILPFYLRQKNLHGNIFYSWKGPTPRVIVADAEVAKEVVLNRFGHFGKPEVTGLVKLLVTGLVSYNGEKWSRHRRIINPSFQIEKLKRMMPAFSASCHAMIERWENLFDSNESTEIDALSEFQNLVGDVISRTAFGSNYDEGRRIFQLQNEEAKLLVQSMRYAMIPGYKYLPTEINKKVKAIEREVRTIIGGIIEKREKEIKTGVQRDDLLGFLIESNMRELQENGNNRKGVLTREEVIEECKLFYFAGQDTTGTLLTWTAVLLGMYPFWQERAREEVLQVFGGREPDFDGLSQLKIVTMVLQEVLRLYPPVLFINRCTEAEAKVGQFSLPKGTEVFLSALFMHHDPDLWGPDALEFKPDRFADGVSRASKNGKAFYAFGGGPRVCIGQNFALVEAKLALAMILKRFSLELSAAYVHAPSTVLTLQPRHGAQIVLHRIDISLSKEDCQDDDDDMRRWSIGADV